MTVRIAPEELERIRTHAEEGYPHEVVGLLGGDRATWTVTRVRLLVNERADSPRNRYRVSALAMQRAEQELNEAGYELVGTYHSHPDHPARYSETDREHALPNMSYIIVSVREGETSEMRSWQLRDDRSAMDEEAIETLKQES